ncbi:MAG: hypothetical protein WCG12_22655 [Alcaligenaceae bacterium]
MKRLIITITISLLSGLASAQTAKIDLPEGLSCSTREGRVKYIATFVPRYYSWLTENIERVPPDVAEYLEQEYADTVKNFPAGEGRYTLLVQNQFWHAWQLRRELDRAAGLAKSSSRVLFTVPDESPLKNEMLVYLSLVDQHRKVMEQFDVYVNFDKNRKTPVLKRDDNFWYSKGLLGGMFSRPIEILIDCAFK